MLDITHERSSAQLKRQWTPELEARFNSLRDGLQAKASGAAAELSRLEASLTSPVVRECYPEEAAPMGGEAVDGADGAEGGAHAALE